MSDTVWLKQVLADANTATESWPDWAKNSSSQISLNSVSGSDSKPDSLPTTPASNGTQSAGQGGLNLK
jgi:hypothetical protein